MTKYKTIQKSSCPPMTLFPSWLPALHHWQIKIEFVYTMPHHLVTNKVEPTSTTSFSTNGSTSNYLQFRCVTILVSNVYKSLELQIYVDLPTFATGTYPRISIS